MRYFKYKAYDDNGNYYSGVDQAISFEYVALSLLQDGKTPSDIMQISKSEYDVLKIGEIQLTKLRNNRNKLMGIDEQDPEENLDKTNIRIATICVIVAIISTVGASLIAAYYVWNVQ